MAIPLLQQIKVGAYVAKQRLMGRDRYPLVLMLEPLFRCNLACAGCGKIDYPDEILNRRLSVEDCLKAVDECGAPVVSIPGGEPLLHKEIDKIVEGITSRGKFVFLCTNALLLEKKIDLFRPSPYLTFSIHLDGLEKEHDKAVSQDGVFERAVSAIKLAKSRGFRVTVNCTLFNDAVPERVAQFFDFATNELKIDGITVSPGYAYERAPDTAHFLSRKQTKELFRSVFRIGHKNGSKWEFSQSSLFLDFLAGNQQFHCSPWSMATRNVFGWQKPCYLLGEGFVGSFKELMETTDWDLYGTGKYEKCANCMAHCGYEGSAVSATVKNPFSALAVAFKGLHREGDMKPEVDFSQQRPAEYVFDTNVRKIMTEMSHTPKKGGSSSAEAAE